MGCNSSTETGTVNKLISSQKPSVWLIGGGPGSQKGKLCQAMIRDYKLKYLSSYQIIQFQQERGGPDADTINQIFKQNKTLSSQLIVRLIKKAIASCGIRRFLIDGFPNSVGDIEEFSRELTAREIDFYGFIYVKISEHKMVESGIEAKMIEKKGGKKEEFEEEVKSIVKKYVESSQKIREEYQKIKKYIEIDGDRGPDSAYQSLKQYFQIKNIQPPRPVKIFFAHFDDLSFEDILCDDLVRKYGLYFYTPNTLINEASLKVNSPEAEFIRKCKKQEQEIAPSFVLSLIRKKIEKHDYSGNFLISGYPRSISDAIEWDKTFGWETKIMGYLTFEIPDLKFKQLFISKERSFEPKISDEQISKKFQIYQTGQQKIRDYYQQRNLLLKVDTSDKNQCLKEIHEFFLSKSFNKKEKMSSHKLIFVSSLTGTSQILQQSLNKEKESFSVIKMSQVYERKIKQNGLYSQLIDSFHKIGKPISGQVAVKVLYNELITHRGSKKVIVEGFPNSIEQLQSWEEQVGDSVELCGIALNKIDQKYIQAKVKEQIKVQKITNTEFEAIRFVKQNATRVEAKVLSSDFLHLFIKSDTKDGQIKQFLKNSNFL